MRIVTRPRVVLLATLLLGALAAPAPALDLVERQAAAVELLDLSADVIQSDNVEYLGTIPIDAPGVGGQVVVRDDLGGDRYFYATGAKGLSIYDITDPELPLLVTTFPFPHAQNEDVKVSDDGKRVLIAADGAIAVPVNPVTTGVHLIDVTNPAAPAMIASSSDLVMRRGTARGAGEHTAECAVADCSVVYGSSGRIYELALAAGRLTAIPNVSWREYTDPATGESGTTSSPHALNRDETGLLISDSTPRLVMDPVGLFDPAARPQKPTVLAVGNPGSGDRLYQHNNRRPSAAEWEARPIGAPVATQSVERPARSISMVDDRPVMGPGELLVSSSETNLRPTCGNTAGLSTWSMIDFDKGAQMVQLETFKPLNGTYLDGSPAVNALGCSGHWFTVSDEFVTASWYEHGVRFFELGLTTGTIDEVGYFQPVVTEAGAAYWVTDEIVYSVDYARGIDILRFDRDAARPAQAELDAAWIANLGAVSQFATMERYLCRLGADN
jgi:hypothetical protein